MADIPNPDKPGTFLWSYARMMRRLTEAGPIDQDCLVEFVLPDGSSVQIASFYMHEGKFVIDLEPVDG